MIVNNGHSSVNLSFPICHGFYVELRSLPDRSEHWEVRILGDRFGEIDRPENDAYRWTSGEQSAVYFNSLEDAAIGAWVHWCQAFVLSYLRGMEYKDPPCPF